jgi:glycosyltransferase involved in cell wall biosynthesis
MVQGGMADWADCGTVRISPGDVSSMAQAIRRLHQEPAHARALGTAGQRMVRTRYARSPLTEALWQIMNTTASGSGGIV